MERIRRLVFLVSHDQQALYDSLLRTFAADPSVQVIKDRRRGERRQRAGKLPADRRQTARRMRTEAEEKLRARGYAVVSILAVKRRPSTRRPS